MGNEFSFDGRRFGGAVCVENEFNMHLYGELFSY